MAGVSFQVWRGVSLCTLVWSLALQPLSLQETSQGPTPQPETSQTPTFRKTGRLSKRSSLFLQGIRGPPGPSLATFVAHGQGHQGTTQQGLSQMHRL